MIKNEGRIFHKEIINGYIDQQANKYINISHKIHENPEIGNEEFFASEILTRELKDAGFEITRDIAGHETGFIARKSSVRREKNEKIS